MIPLRKELFWDVEYGKLDAEKHKRIIIERVLTLGNLEEFIFILNNYSRQTLVKEIQQLAYIDPKTLSFVVSYFDINKKKLRCFTKKQSTIQHWI